MPNVCAVYGCNNNKVKTAGTEIRYFRFPKDAHYRQIWTNLCCRADDFNVKNAIVCSAHFTRDDYIDDMKSRLLGIESPKNRRLLKKEAVPSALLHNGVGRKNIMAESEATAGLAESSPLEGEKVKVMNGVQDIRRGDEEEVKLQNGDAEKPQINGDVEMTEMEEKCEDPPEPEDVMRSDSEQNGDSNENGPEKVPVESSESEMKEVENEDEEVEEEPMDVESSVPSEVSTEVKVDEEVKEKEQIEDENKVEEVEDVVEEEEEEEEAKEVEQVGDDVEVEKSVDDKVVEEKGEEKDEKDESEIDKKDTEPEAGEGDKKSSEKEKEEKESDEVQQVEETKVNSSDDKGASEKVQVKATPKKSRNKEVEEVLPTRTLRARKTPKKYTEDDDDDVKIEREVIRDDSSDIEMIEESDPLAISDADVRKAQQKEKKDVGVKVKDTNVIIIDTNTLLKNQGNLAAAVAQSSSNTVQPVTITTASSATATPTPTTVAAAAAAATAVSNVNIQTAIQAITGGVPAQGLQSAYITALQQVSQKVLLAQGGQVPMNSQHLAQLQQYYNSLGHLQDDAYVIEAPSFIVPYVMEGKPKEPIKSFLNRINKDMEEYERKEKEENEKKEAEERKKKEEEEKLKGEEEKEKADEEKEEKKEEKEEEEKEKKEEEEEAVDKEKEEETKEKQDETNNKTQEEKDDKESEDKETNKETSDKSNENSNSEHAGSGSEEEKENKVESDKTVNDSDNKEKSADKEKEKKESSGSSNEKVKEGKAGDTEDEDKENKQKESENVVDLEKEEKNKEDLSHLGKWEPYYRSALGKFFLELGLNQAQEFLQSDLLRMQKRKLDKMKTAPSKEGILGVKLLERQLEVTRHKNSHLRVPLKICKFCNFKTESAMVMDRHLESPHMVNYTYKCNYCEFETRGPQVILFHMEAEHNVRGRLERAPAFFQCPLCPYEDNNKSKITRHSFSCSKKFKPEKNCELVDWEPPAKIPKVHRGRPNTLGKAFEPVKMPNLLPKGLAGMNMNIQSAVASNLLSTATAAAAAAAAGRGRGRPVGSYKNTPQTLNQARPTTQGGTITKSTSTNQLLYTRGGTNSATSLVQQVSGNAQQFTLGNQMFHSAARVPRILPSSTASSVNLIPGLAASSSITIQARTPIRINPSPQSVQSKAGNTKSPQQPSISITPLPRAGQQAQAVSKGATVTPTRDASGKPSFVICEICDGYIKDLEQLRNHMNLIHKVKIHPKMIYNRPPLNCQKCQHRFFTDQGLERHLLGTHGLVTSSMQEAANKGKDAGRCPICGKVFQWKLLNHVSRDHKMTLKPAHLSYKCTVCTATFNMYRLFENHVYSAHSVVNKNKGEAAKKQGPGDSPLKINDEITIIPQPSVKSNKTEKSVASGKKGDSAPNVSKEITITKVGSRPTRRSGSSVEVISLDESPNKKRSNKEGLMHNPKRARTST